MLERAKRSWTLGLLVGGAMLVSVASAHPWPSRELAAEKRLASRSADERLAAARELGGLSASQAHDLVKKALRDDDARVRLVAARTAVYFDYVDCGPLVLPWLQSQDERERRVGLEVLASFADEQVVAEAATALADPDVGVRLAAVRTLSRARQGAMKSAASALLGALDDDEHRVRTEAAAALGRVGSKEVALTLAAHLQDTEPPVREQLALALGVLGDKSVTPALLVALADPEDSVVSAVASSLGALGERDAVLGLTAIAERSPFGEPEQRAIEALAQVNSSASSEVLLSLLEKPDRARFVERVLSRAGDAVDGPLSTCIEQSAGDDLLACVRVSVARQGPSAPVLSAVREGRIAALSALSILMDAGDDSAVILALEQLADLEPRGARESLAYLMVQPSLPKEAGGPLEDALRAEFWSPREVAAILETLSRVKRPVRSAFEVRPYFESSDVLVQAGAARLMVARGASGEDLRELLFRSPGEVQQATLESIARVGSTAQASELLRLLVEGKHGNHRALLSVFDEVAVEGGSLDTEALTRLWQGARGPSRDALLSALVRTRGKSAVQLLAMTQAADRLAMAQLAWYVPEGVLLARRLVEDSDDRVVALALVALGLRGDARDVDVLIRESSAESNRATFARAAAWSGLAALAIRKVEPPPLEKLDASACSSAHIGLRAAAWRLHTLAGRGCASGELEDLLLHDPDARIRAMAARLLRAVRPTAPALARCARYEARVEVAGECTGAEQEGAGDRFGPRETAPREGLPYAIQSLGRASNGVLRVHTPVALRFSVDEGAGALGEIQATAVSDRRGRVFFPVGTGVVVDEAWAY